MSIRALMRRIEKLEQRMEQVAEARSRSSAECICFPLNEPPFFGFPIEMDIASRVKCPLHGDRLKCRFDYIYVSKWRRETEPRRRQTLSAQHQKAWAASFPSDLRPAEEAEADDGTYLRLKDGTRLLALEFEWKKNQASKPLTLLSGSTETAQTFQQE